MKKSLAVTLLLSLMLALASCGGEVTPSAAPSPSPSASSTPSPSPEATPAADRTQVNIVMLKGPTGMGAAKLMADDEAGLTALDYQFSVDADVQAIPAKLTNGEVDIAAMPTNMAANLYNKSEDIQMLALNTLGVLYILENGSTVQSVGDLAGKTIYATGQGANPEYVLNHLLRENGLTPGEDVTIEWKASDELSTLAAAGEVELCMLPVPAATGALMKNPNLRTALDLTQLWGQTAGDGSVLTMGCVVARKAFVQEHPEAVAAFLKEYAASIEYVTSSPEEAAPLMTQYGITPSDAVAKAAIPQANVVFITGTDMAASIQGYYEVLWQADPASIGGSIPSDGFYYVP